MIRQVVEAALLLSLAVILFRGFVAEGYMISTGSMAPCLLGYHRQVVCPDCAFAFSRGTRYDIDDSILADGSGDSTDLGMLLEQATICPNCGFDQIDVHLVPRNEGDQLLVQKNFYQLRSPRRWEVVVFRHPDDVEQAYVKRVVGLPGEEVQLVDGDVHVDGELQRKSLSVQRSMRICIYDNDFSPLDEEWEPRWHPSPPTGGWIPDGNAFEHRSVWPSKAGDEEFHWLGYRHWLRSGGHHQTSVSLAEWPHDAPSPAALQLVPVAANVFYDVDEQELVCTGVMSAGAMDLLLSVSNDLEFKRAVRKLADQSHFGEITDTYGYNHPRVADLAFPVHDLMVETTVSRLVSDEGQRATGQFRIRLHDGWRWFETVFDFDRRKIGLFTEQSAKPLRSAEMPQDLFDHPRLVEMSLFDRQVLVAVDGEAILPPLRYAHEERRRRLPPEPVRLGAARAQLRIEHLRLFRDVYYTPKRADFSGDRFDVKADELFVLGDNSPVSVDSRLWDAKTIPQRLLIGKPFVVHLPSTQERIEIGGEPRHIRVPDFSRVRYIQ